MKRSTTLTPRSTRRAQAMAFVISGCATVLALAVRIALNPLLGNTSLPYITLFPTLVLIGWLFGLWPAIFSVVLGAAGTMYWLQPAVALWHVEAPAPLTGLILYLVLGLICTLIGHAMNRARLHAEDLAELAVERRQFLDGLLSSISDGFACYDRNWQVTFANDEFLRRAQLTSDQVIGQNLWVLFQDAVGNEAHTQLQAAMRERRTVEYEVFYEPWNRWFADKACPTADGGLAVLSRDITDAKRSQTLRMAQTTLLEMIAKGRPLAECLESLTAAATRLQPGVRACVLVADTDCTHIAHVFTDSVSASFGSAVVGAPISDVPVGTCGTAIRTGLPVDCADIAGGSGWSAGWRDACLSHGIQACHSTPVLGDDGTPVASFFLCLSEKRAITEWERSIAEFGAHAAAAAIGRDRAQEVAARGRQLYLELVEHCPFGIYIVDSNFRIVQMNRGSRQGAFVNVQPVIGRPFEDAMRILWPEEVAAEIIGYFRHTLHTGEHFKSKEFVRPRGDVQNTEGYEWELHRIALPDGQPGVICYYYDSTELRQAEKSLLESEQRLHLALDAAEQGVWTFDPVSGALTFDTRCRELWGVEHDTPVDLALWFSAIHPEDRARVQSDVDQAAGTTGAGKYRTQYRVNNRSSGAVLWVEASAQVTFDQGRPVLWNGVVADVTARHAAERALQASEERFRLIVESARDFAIITMDLGGIITGWNKGATNLLGWTELEAVNHHGRLIFTPEDNESGAPEWELSTATREGRAVNERWHVRKDGSRFWGSGLVMPLLHDGSAPQGLVKIMRDRTEAREAEFALREADRRKDEFLATLAHELRNPLAPVRSSLRLLRMAGADAATRERILTIMDRQVTHMVRLVDDLLEVSRITRGKVDLKRETLDLAALARAAFEAVAISLPKLEHEVVLKLDEPALVDGDPVRLTQVVSNLIGNALKYTPTEGRIEVSLWSQHVEAVLSIRDDGVGIPAEMLPRVFELFTQVDRNLGRSQGGLGIGLALVRRLVEMHGGQVEASSAGPGLGSEFIVRLPLVSVAASEPASNKAPSTESAVDLSERRILVVDDNRDAADILAELLEMTGAEVLLAYDGRTAIEHVNAKLPALVLLDIGMPGMDGYAVAAEIRRHRKFDSIRLVALTGWGQAEDRLRTEKAGFDGHLVKPVDYSALMDVLKDSTRKR